MPTTGLPRFSEWLEIAKSADGRLYRATSKNVMRSMYASVARQHVGALETATRESLSHAIDDAALSASTKRKVIGLFRHYFDSLKAAGEISDNPADRLMLTADQEPARTSWTLPPDIRDRVLKLCLQIMTGEFVVPPTVFRRDRVFRDATIAALSLGNGLAAGEITRLRPNDPRLFVAPGWIHVSAHAPHPARQVPMTPLTRTVLGLWLKREQTGQWLFEARGAQISGPTCWRAVAAILKLADVSLPKQGVQALRNSYAYGQFAEGRKRSDVKLWLGHARLRSTERLQDALAVPSTPA